MSKVNTGPIDVNYPVTGVVNTTDQFRDNWASIKQNTEIVADELTELQNKVLLKGPLSNIGIDNNMSGTLISNALVSTFRHTTKNLGNNITGTLTIDVGQGDVQYATITGPVSLEFTGWPNSNSGSAQNVAPVPMTSAGFIRTGDSVGVVGSRFFTEFTYPASPLMGYPYWIYDGDFIPGLFTGYGFGSGYNLPLGPQVNMGIIGNSRIYGYPTIPGIYNFTISGTARLSDGIVLPTLTQAYTLYVVPSLDASRTTAVQSNVQVILTQAPGLSNTAVYFPNNLYYGASTLENYNGAGQGGYVTFPANVDKIHYNFTSTTAGATIEVETINRPRKPTSGNVGTVTQVNIVGEGFGIANGNITTSGVAEIQNLGVTSVAAGNNIAVSAATGTVTVTNTSALSQVPLGVPNIVGAPGDIPGSVRADSGFLYVCTGTYDGYTPIWKRAPLAVY
jgi:hypothetical protein